MITIPQPPSFKSSLSTALLWLGTDCDCGRWKIQPKPGYRAAAAEIPGSTKGPARSGTSANRIVAKPTIIRITVALSCGRLLAQTDRAPAEMLISFSFNTSSLTLPTLYDGHRALSLIFSIPGKTALLQLTPCGHSSLPGAGSLPWQHTVPPGAQEGEKVEKQEC